MQQIDPLMTEKERSVSFSVVAPHLLLEGATNTAERHDVRFALRRVDNHMVFDEFKVNVYRRMRGS